jgi:hypothetical protein
MSERKPDLEKENEALKRQVAELQTFAAGVLDLAQKLLPNRKRRGYADPDEVLRGIVDGKGKGGSAHPRRRHGQGIPV